MDHSIEDHLGCLPIFPLPGIVLFPHTILPLHVFEHRYRKMVRDARHHGLPIAMAHIDASAPPPERGEPPTVCPVAGVGKMRSVGELGDGRFLIELHGCARVRIVEELPPDEPYRRVRSELLTEPPPGPDARQKIQLFRSMLMSLREHRDVVSELLALINAEPEPGTLADIAGHLICEDSGQRQALLEEVRPERRLALLIDQLSEMMFPDALSSDSGLN